MFHIDLLLIHIVYLHFVITVDHFYGALGIKECNVVVNSRAFGETSALFFSLSFLIECKLNVHKRCTRNVANDCGLDKKKLANVLADLNISTEPQKMVKKTSCLHKLIYSFVFVV